MKKIILILLLFTGLFSCKNFDIEHPDFDYTAGYFPYQYPVRTLVLGDYIYDNSNDNAGKFVISVAMGGVYENKVDREFEFEVDESLCNNIRFSASGPQIKALPKSYYTLSSNNKIVIPKGKVNGGVTVQLTEAFFNDPDAIRLTYVVPLKLKGSTDVDSILVGSASTPGADVRDESKWIISPKNFTMFAVKYINEFHGNYFHYGSSKVKNEANVEVESTTYSQKYVENNPVVLLTTTGRRQVSMTTSYHSAILAGSLELLLTFNGNNCTITNAPGTAYTITGTGTFKSKEYEWGAKKRDGIELKYTVTSAQNTYEATEVLVARDRAVVMEIYSPSIN
jgi:hypothetical protein